MTKAQKEHILKSHIFVEEKQDSKIKARKVVRGTSSKTTSQKKMSAFPWFQLKQ
jgi:hypothetical protein